MQHNSFILEGLAKELKNPIVEKVEDVPSINYTKKEHIVELQRILVQTCLDFINKHGLKDIYSAKCGEWQSVTDSHIRVDGIRTEKHRRKNGEIAEIYNTYVIGEHM